MDELRLPPEVSDGLQEFVESAQSALGPDLVSLVLFGSAAEGQMRHKHVRVRLPDDRLQVATVLFLLEKDLHAHGVPPETQRPFQVRDRQARVVEEWHS